MCYAGLLCMPQYCQWVILHGWSLEWSWGFWIEGLQMKIFKIEVWCHFALIKCMRSENAIEDWFFFFAYKFYKKMSNFQFRIFSFLTLKSRIATITPYFKHLRSHNETIRAWKMKACTTSTAQIQYPALLWTFTWIFDPKEVLCPDLLPNPEHWLIYRWFCIAFWKFHALAFDMN